MTEDGAAPAQSSLAPAMPRLTGALAPRERWQANGVSLPKAIGVVSTRSAFLLIREAFYGTTRFDDFAERAGISEPVCAARLRELVGEGLLAREQYQGPGRRAREQYQNPVRRARPSYRLTEKGAGLFPALAALMQWGDRWLADDGGPIEVRHRDSGEPGQAGFG